MSKESIAYVRTELHPTLPPPASEVGPIHWIRVNLFSTWYYGVGTVISAVVIAYLAWGIFDWAVLTAVWEAKDFQDCLERYVGEPVGACWGFVDARFDQFMYGPYDPASYWRPNLTGLLLIIGLLPVMFDKIPGRKIAGPLMIFVFPWVATALLHGPIEMTTLQSTLGIIISVVLLVGGLFLGYRGTQTLNPGQTMLGFGIAYAIAVMYFLAFGFGLEVIPTNKFGGFMLTLVLSAVAIGVSLPLGIVLALGRRANNMPLIQMLCIGFIELIRAVPLITVLFMAQFMLPLFLPEGMDFDNLVRALVGLSLFSSAYMAEVVRGGLQAIPKGQFEAADALGLNYNMSMRLIVLPQALKIVIPNIVSTFIGLFKDTTLVSIIGLLDLLLTMKQSVTSTQWLGMEHTGYIFVGSIYLVCCFGMSRYSIYLEKKLHTGHKR
ncbi:amino acid ABC transporter permease [Hwanghaeella sp.]|jgi:general L-amino acid transport system permease protein|uniref:amino acid ABC transporter permease n=1 Tax=Hwanghaeella sp. TaxID=2605943 RepID=UPI003CCB991A